jgi:type II secretory pathway component GspD/PulD (secretin)
MELSHSPFNFIGTDQINAVLIAAETEGDGQMLEHPSLTCFNGQRASASFMNQYAYISDYEVVSSNLDPKITVLTFGNIIDMRPVVSSDRKYITLEVRPSSVQLQGVFTEFLSAPRIFTDGGDGGGGAVTPAVSYPLEMPNVLVKTLRSTILLPDKASLLIGGFQRSLRENTHSGIPFLSHIPFLGRLFSRNGTYDEDRRLFYLLHAEILDLNEKEALQ